MVTETADQVRQLSIQKSCILSQGIEEGDIANVEAGGGKTYLWLGGFDFHFRKISGWSCDVTCLFPWSTADTRGRGDRVIRKRRVSHYMVQLQMEALFLLWTLPMNWARKLPRMGTSDLWVWLGARLGFSMCPNKIINPSSRTAAPKDRACPQHRWCWKIHEI